MGNISGTDWYDSACQAVYERERLATTTIPGLTKKISELAKKLLECDREDRDKILDELDKTLDEYTAAKRLISSKTGGV